MKWMVPPFLARWTGAIPAATSNDSVAAHIDVFATLAEHIGITGLDLVKKSAPGRVPQRDDMAARTGDGEA